MINIIQKKQLIDFFIEKEIFSLDEAKSPAIPYQVKLNRLCSYPVMLRRIAQMFGDSMKKTSFDLVSGPYTDIPLATTISLEFNWPMIFVRKERKDHGMERLIEGNFYSGQRVVVIDDEVNDVEGTLQLLGRLEGSGLKVVGLFVLLDREDGALHSIRKRGYKCEALLRLNDILIQILESSKISSSQHQQLENFLKTNKVNMFLAQNTPS